MTLRQARKLDKRRCEPSKQPHKIGTLFRAVGRLRKSWRSARPLSCDARGLTRDTGLDENSPDFFAANRVAVLAKRVVRARTGKWPAWNVDASTLGAPRSLS